MEQLRIPNFTKEDFIDLITESKDFYTLKYSDVKEKKYKVFKRGRENIILAVWDENKEELTINFPTNNAKDNDELMDNIKKNHHSFAPTFWERLFEKITFKEILTK